MPESHECLGVDSRRGFAMLVILIVLVTLSAGAMFFVYGAGDERMIGRSLREAGQAFYAAEAGVNDIVAVWELEKYHDALTSSGDSLDLGWTALGGGLEYHALIRRTDGGVGRRAFSLRITGRGTRVGGGRSVRYVTMVSYPINFDIKGAIEGGFERFEADTDGSFSGIDTNPPGWDPSICGPLEDRAGVTWHDGALVRIKDPSLAFGNPVVEIDPSINLTNIFQWEDFDFADLVAMADIIIPSERAAAGQIKPHTAGGDCWYTPWKNWGDPDDPSGVCGDYFPIIYRPGDLTIRNGKGGGQGILIVDGDLRIEDDFEFTGIIIVKGEVRIEDSVKVTGAIISGDRTRIHDPFFPQDGLALIQYSSCAVERALIGSGLYKVKPIINRSWRQAL